MQNGAVSYSQPATGGAGPQLLGSDAAGGGSDGAGGGSGEQAVEHDQRETMNPALYNSKTACGRYPYPACK